MAQPIKTRPTRRLRRALAAAGVNAEVHENKNPVAQPPEDLPEHATTWGFLLRSDVGHMEGCEIPATSAGKETLTAREAAVVAIMAMANRYNLPVTFEGGTDVLLGLKPEEKEKAN